MSNQARRKALTRATLTASVLAALGGFGVHQSEGAPPPTIKAALASTDGCRGANGDSIETVALSFDTRLVGFASQATNLVSGDSNLADDVFLHDRLANTTRRVSVASDGTQGNDDSVFPNFSADGRFVAFHSIATNLVPGDGNGWADVFVHDLITGVTELVSVGSDGAPGNGHSVDPQLSADGRFVAFFSSASNFAPGDLGNFDVFVRDRLLRRTERVSIRANPVEDLLADPPLPNGDSFSPAISADGRFIAFHSGASNLVANDTNNAADVFVHDRVVGLTSRVSKGIAGTQADGNSAHPVMTADGRAVAYHSAATNLVLTDTNNVPDIFVSDPLTGVTTRAVTNAAADFALQPNGGSYFPAMTPSGSAIAFFSSASNLFPGDTNNAFDVFLHDRVTTLTARMSNAFSGLGPAADGDSFHPALGSERAVVAFNSAATNLVPNDSNGRVDTFIGDAAGVSDGLPALPEPSVLEPPVQSPWDTPRELLCDVDNLPPLVTTTTRPLPTTTLTIPSLPTLPTSPTTATTTTTTTAPTSTTTSQPDPLACVPSDPFGFTISEFLECEGWTVSPPGVPPCAFFDPLHTTARQILECAGVHTDVEP